MFKWFRELRDNVHLNKLNNSNKKLFAEDMRKEREDPDSIFNAYNLILSPDGTKVSMIVTLPETVAQYPDERVIDLKLKEIIAPITRYIIFDNNWVEYVLPPKIYHIEEATTDDNVEPSTALKDGDPVSLTYLAVWEWVPMQIDDPYWKQKLSAVCVTGAMAVIGSIICAMFALVF